MAKTQYSSASPYFETPQTYWYMLPINLREIPPDTSDTLITLSSKYHNRPDLLSYDLYNTPSYWWIFMVRNMDLIRDPLWDFNSGMSVWVPSASRLHQLLG